MGFVVDKDVCIGCGFCVDCCPRVFEMDRDGLAIAIEKVVDEDVVNSATYIIEECPVSAIKK